MRLTDEQIKVFKEGKKHPGLYIYDLFDTIEALQQGNEQLQAQNAAIREAMQQVQHDIDSAECRDDLDGIRGYIDEILSTLPTTYHNLDDVEALKVAREVLRALNQADWCDCDHCKGVREAIAAIDKIGGREDG